MVMPRFHTGFMFSACFRDPEIPAWQRPALAQVDAETRIGEGEKSLKQLVENFTGVPFEVQRPSPYRGRHDHLAWNWCAYTQRQL